MRLLRELLDYLFFLNNKAGEMLYAVAESCWYVAQVFSTLIKKYYKITTTILLITNAVFVLMMWKDYAYVRSKTIYDIDLVREKYVKGMRYNYRVGCLNAANNFDGSVQNAAEFCNQMIEFDVEPRIEEEVVKLGIIQKGRYNCDAYTN